MAPSPPMGRGDAAAGTSPARVGTNLHEVAGTDDAPGGRLEEQLRPRRLVDEIVEARSTSRFFLAGLLAALVGDAGGPHFLGVERRQQRRLFDRHSVAAFDQR